MAHIALNYVDRGDPSSWDFETSDFITDGNWHELDLSNIVPEGTKAVCFLTYIIDDIVASHISFRKKGNTNTVNKFVSRTQLANVLMDGNGIVFCDTDRKIEYRTSNTTFSWITLTIRGWYI